MRANIDQVGHGHRLLQFSVISVVELWLQDLVRQICVVIADRGAAEFAVGNLIVELISSDGNWEAIMIGLKALLSIYMSASARAAGRHVSDAQVGSSSAPCMFSCLLSARPQTLSGNPPAGSAWHM